MKRLKTFKLFAFVFLAIGAAAQAPVNVYPTHWWAGMKNPKLQLMVHGEDIAQARSIGTNYPGLRIDKVNKVANDNYVFIDLTLAPGIKPGMAKIRFVRSGGTVEVPFEIKARSRGAAHSGPKGVTQEDFVYLIMPDRFANGDASNDAYPDMLDKQADRNNPFLRHGGDLQGIINNLDYLQNLGVTAIWMTPVVENNTAQSTESGTQRSSYHGYHFTDQYKIDKRFGGHEAYKKLGDELHKRGMKLVQDAVYNHIGQDHFTFRDKPMPDWVNQWPKYQQTSYKDQPLLDPYAAQADKALSINGWFTEFLPDLNQRNPFVANYLIQHAIWSTEEFGVDGWRVDTYFYSDSSFLNKVNEALYREYPTLTIFGEAWVHTVINSAYFSQNNLNTSFKHNLQGVTDFPLLFAMIDGLNQPFGWTEGVHRVYATLAQDVAYKDPTRNCIFFDNHDLDRFYSVIGEDYNKYKMGMNWLLTLRGIPQLYYGTEILMKNFKQAGNDATVRFDFPGGWAGDKENKFRPEGRNPQEQAAWLHVSTLANFRKSSPALTKGRLMQYVPEAGLYTYFRYHPSQTVMVISHTGKEDVMVKMARFSERTGGFTRLRDVHSGEVRPLQDFTIRAGQSHVFELLK